VKPSLVCHCFPTIVAKTRKKPGKRKRKKNKGSVSWAHQLVCSPAYEAATLHRLLGRKKGLLGGGKKRKKKKEKRRERG